MARRLRPARAAAMRLFRSRISRDGTASPARKRRSSRTARARRAVSSSMRPERRDHVRGATRRRSFGGECARLPELVHPTRDLVAERYRRRRLDEHRSTGRRRIVHDPADRDPGHRGARGSRSARCASSRSRRRRMMRLEAAPSALEDANEPALRGAQRVPMRRSAGDASS